MSLLNVIGIADAIAAPANQAAAAGPGSSVFMTLMLAGVVMFYFMVIRPQSKQAKDQKQLLDDISKGDEVLTAVFERMSVHIWVVQKIEMYWR